MSLTYITKLEIFNFDPEKKSIEKQESVIIEKRIWTCNFDIMKLSCLFVNYIVKIFCRFFIEYMSLFLSTKFLRTLFH